jgi:hypothetical protein
MPKTKYPRYRPHQTVEGSEILQIERIGTGARLTVRDSDETIEVDSFFLVKHTPEVGGFVVVEADGYRSYLSAERFHEHYTPVTNLAPLQD